MCRHHHHHHHHKHHKRSEAKELVGRRRPIAHQDHVHPQPSYKNVYPQPTTEHQSPWVDQQWNTVKTALEKMEQARQLVQDIIEEGPANWRANASSSMVAMDEAYNEMSRIIMGQPRFQLQAIRSILELKPEACHLRVVNLSPTATVESQDKPILVLCGAVMQDWYVDEDYDQWGVCPECYAVYSMLGKEMSNAYEHLQNLSPVLGPEYAK